MKPLPRLFVFMAALAAVLPAAGRALAYGGPPLIKVAQIKGVQPTGIAVSKDGRIFVSFPRWRDKVPFSVAEVKTGGALKPYPNRKWNQWKPGTSAKSRFVCVQSLLIDDQAQLWALDAASPRLAGVVRQGAKLVRIDLKTNKVKRVIRLGSKAAPAKGYLNDLRIDTRRQVAYLTDSGLGALVTVDLKTGKARRLLHRHPSTKAERVLLTVGGKKLRFAAGGAPQIHADGIAWDRRNGYLYYHALTGYNLYRIATVHLRHGRLGRAALGRKVENLGRTPAPDGMIFGPKGNLFMADLERDAIVFRTPKGALKTLVRDRRLRWVDSFSLGPGGMLYFTCSRIHETEWFVPGAEVAKMTFGVYKVDISRLH